MFVGAHLQIFFISEGGSFRYNLGRHHFFGLQLVHLEHFEADLMGLLGLGLHFCEVGDLRVGGSVK